MPQLGNFAFDELRFSAGPVILVGAHATRAKVAAQYPTVKIGSLYISSVATGGTGRVYLKITESGGASGTATDWQKVTTSAAD